MNEKILEVINLSKKFGRKFALNGVSFSLFKGEIIGLLGENGSGKTTLLRIIMGILKPSKGKVMFKGEKITEKAKLNIFYVPEKDIYYQNMKVDEMAEFLSNFYRFDFSKWRSLKKFFNLNENLKIKQLSRGYRERLKIALAFSCDVELYLFDEPLSGIDPVSRSKILDMLLSEFVEKGQTILISTHLVEEVESFLDRVIFLKNGEIILESYADDLREKYKGSILDIYKKFFS
ncbi:ABC transporter ATP-binding protein [Candidatus Pacearchaeota archaeon]|nr:MAG: ABC transporter ATP-binding protein [Candidatus Pacearchaeota archaeon]